jgi:hypothetical protein
MNRLYMTRTYLVGAMEDVPDGGIQWRERITPWLNRRGVIVFNPCNKPCDVGSEKPEDRQKRAHFLKEGRYDEFIESCGDLRPIDLRMVDITDFLIVSIDTDVHACGTYEEVSWANRCKKPMIVHVKGGKQNIPPWLLLMLKDAHVMVFGTWDEVKEYLDYVNDAPEVETMKRWVFFDLDKVTAPAIEGFETRQRELAQEALARRKAEEDAVH